mmetsp:Transcript_26034/g.104168  ORF Transcript_26034/g.104168 Transcript_26034/m.104168 type:complete len:80 (+) Transcript_26034:537-776(+)
MTFERVRHQTSVYRQILLGKRTPPHARPECGQFRERCLGIRFEDLVRSEHLRYEDGRVVVTQASQRFLLETIRRVDLVA